MSLVDYLDTSSSASESEDNEGPSRKTAKLLLAATITGTFLPTATSLLGKRKVNEDVEDCNDPTKHNGRIRGFKHERGNWSTYVYVPVNFELLEDLQAQCMKQLASLDKLEFYAIEEFHISLSKTVVLQYHLIESFTQSLCKALINNDGFSVSFSNLKIYTNEESTRTFISVQISEIYNQKMKRLLDQIDAVMCDYKLPVFYEKPSYHVSIIWCLGDQMAVLERHLPALQKLVSVLIVDEKLQLCIEELRCKSGNKEFIFMLK